MFWKYDGVIIKICFSFSLDSVEKRPGFLFLYDKNHLERKRWKEHERKQLNGKNIFHGFFRFSWIGTMLEISFSKNKLLKVNHTILYNPLFTYLYLHHLQNWQRERVSVVKVEHCCKVKNCFSSLLSRIEEIKNTLINSSYSLNFWVILVCKPAKSLHMFFWTYLIT